jgi:hypothetical protein
LWFNIKCVNCEICPKYYNGDITKHSEGEVICPKYYNADTRRIIKGKIVKTPNGNFNFTFNPKVNNGEIIRAAHIKLSWDPKYPKKDSQISFQMIASEIKNKGKYKGYPLDSVKVKYRQSGNHFFDVSSSSFSSQKTSFLVEIRVPHHHRRINETDKKNVSKFIPIGSIKEATLILHTSDAPGKLKRRKREARAEQAKR